MTELRRRLAGLPLVRVAILLSYGQGSLRDLPDCAPCEQWCMLRVADALVLAVWALQRADPDYVGPRPGATGPPDFERGPLRGRLRACRKVVRDGAFAVRARDVIAVMDR